MKRLGWYSAGLQSIIATILLVLVAGLGQSFRPDQPSKQVKSDYLANLARLDSTVADLQRTIQQPQSEALVQAAFRRSRLAYKQVEFLTEFYFSGSAKSLNGPPVAEGEVDDGVGIVIQPTGFQVAEELIFPLDADQHTALLQQVTSMQNTIRQLRRVAGYNELTDSQIFDAMRLEVVRLITLGITGFDSPVALHSLPESIAALESIEYTLRAYPLAVQHSALSAQLDQTIDRAIQALRKSSFNRFDRLSFIRNYAYPLNGLLMDAQLALGYPLATSKRMLRPTARTLSDSNAFDPTFFLPYSHAQPTADRIALGKLLFFNPALSGNGQRSCATCHQPNLAFTDGEASPFDLDAKQRIGRNTPTLLNAAFQSFQFMDSRSFSLEDQITDVIHNTQEMSGSIAQATAVLRKDSTYKAQFANAYSDGVTETNLKNALASYIRSLVSLNARPDRYLRGEEVALTAQEKQGFNVFMGKGKCATCHFFPLFNGTVPPAYVKTESEVLGTPATDAEKQLDTDAGRYKTTKIDIHRNAFKTPTVRQAALTAPYMHNGVYKTLNQVVDFYDKGGGTGLGFTLENQTLPTDKLNLTAAEKRALVAFMKSL
ncbi:cytochrome-c peroxidase [Spirosoma agri]|uniref:Cytochrome-c peroxidase n=1 Tax=Spirosoma agri TaxID=1987381 RepID=A0A6M0IMP0_9BACT|nr:cytochrome c peroxidase [Spirosoma agri]NEU69508.1 cytochrome-c peroxidase [Spirosoma agri]